MRGIPAVCLGRFSRGRRRGTGGAGDDKALEPGVLLAESLDLALKQAATGLKLLCSWEKRRRRRKRGAEGRGRRVEGRGEMAVTHWRSSQAPARALSSFGGSGQRRRCYGGACCRARRRARKIVQGPGVSDARSDNWTDETEPRERGAGNEASQGRKPRPRTSGLPSLPPHACGRRTTDSLVLMRE